MQRVRGLVSMAWNVRPTLKDQSAEPDSSPCAAGKESNLPQSMPIHVEAGVVRHSDWSIPLDALSGISTVQVDHTSSLFATRQERKIGFHTAGTVRTLDFTNNHDGFVEAWSYTWLTAGIYLVEVASRTLISSGSVRVAGVPITKDGVWVPGNWKFLVWQGKPR